MSDIFANMDTSMGSTLTQGRVQAGEAAAKLKDKKEETSKTIEEGLASLKVMMGGKGVTKAIIGSPVVRQYASQLKKKAADGVKDIVQKGIAKVQDGLSQATRGAVGDNPAAIASRMGGQTAQNAGTSQAAAASSRATEELAEDSAKFQEARAAEQNFGREAEQQFDDWDAPPAYEAEEQLAQTTSSALTPAAAAAPAEVDAASFFSTPAAATAAGAPAPIFDADAIAARAAAAAAKTAAAAGGEDAAVGFGEAAMGALDAIPGLDLFTLLGGAALGIGAAAKKRVAAKAVMPPPPQAHVAIAAGFQNV